MMKRAHDQTRPVFRNSEAHREVGGINGPSSAPIPQREDDRSIQANRRIRNSERTAVVLVLVLSDPRVTKKGGRVCGLRAPS